MRPSPPGCRPGGRLLLRSYGPDPDSPLTRSEASGECQVARLGGREWGAMERGFEVLGTMRGVETIAVGQGVRVRQHLGRTYGRARWRKMKG